MCMCTDVTQYHFALDIVRCFINVKGICMAGVQYGFRLCFYKLELLPQKNVNTVKGFQLHVFIRIKGRMQKR